MPASIQQEQGTGSSKGFKGRGVMVRPHVPASHKSPRIRRLQKSLGKVLNMLILPPELERIEIKGFVELDAVEKGFNHLVSMSLVVGIAMFLAVSV